MAFFVDDEFSNSREVLAIPRRHRLPAVGLWTLAGSWSANKLTDGKLSHNELKELGATPALIDALVDAAGLWERYEGGIQFLNWPKWQRTKAQVTAYRQREREKKQNQRNARKTSSAPESTSSDTYLSPGDTVGDENLCPQGNPDIPIPVPIPVPIPTGVNSGVSVQSVAAGPAHTPSKFCPRHPDGTTERCGDCANARTAFSQWQSQRDADATAAAVAIVDARAARRSAIEECIECDSAGWRLDSPDEAAVRCSHGTPSGLQLVHSATNQGRAAR